jgi:hypothetical protein
VLPGCWVGRARKHRGRGRIPWVAFFPEFETKIRLAELLGLEIQTLLLPLGSTRHIVAVRQRKESFMLPVIERGRASSS